MGIYYDMYCIRYFMYYRLALADTSIISSIPVTASYIKFTFFFVFIFLFYR